MGDNIHSSCSVQKCSPKFKQSWCEAVRFSHIKCVSSKVPVFVESHVGGIVTQKGNIVLKAWSSTHMHFLNSLFQLLVVSGLCIPLKTHYLNVGNGGFPPTTSLKTSTHFVIFFSCKSCLFLFIFFLFLFLFFVGMVTFFGLHVGGPPVALQTWADDDIYVTRTEPDPNGHTWKVYRKTFRNATASLWINVQQLACFVCY